MYLHTLVSFTSPNTWALLKVKSLMALKPGMSQLCSNVLGALVQKGFFITLRVSKMNIRVKTHKHIHTLIVYVSIESSAANFTERNKSNQCHIEADLI